MNIVTMIQAQDTGRFLFVKEDEESPWTCPGTKIYFNWIVDGGVLSLHKEVARWIDIEDAPMEWFATRHNVSIVHYRVPTESQVYWLKDQYQWRSLLDFPEKTNRFIDVAMKDLFFLDSATRTSDNDLWQL